MRTTFRANHFSKILKSRLDGPHKDKIFYYDRSNYKIIYNFDILKTISIYSDDEYMKVFSFFICAFLARRLYAWCFPIPLAVADTAKGFEIVVALIATSVLVQRLFAMRTVALLLRALSLFTIGAMGTGYMTSIAYYIGRQIPFLDSYLFAVDQLLGFDWLAYMRFIDAHAWLDTPLFHAYQSISWQPVCILILLAFRLDHKGIYAFLTVELVGLAVVSVIAIAVPVLGVYHYLGLSPADHQNITLDDPDKWTAPILWMREAAFYKVVSPTVGLITFPSFHAASAILYMWGWWRIPVARYCGFFLNLVMLFATPLHGSHYLVDIIAGTLIAMVLITWISNILAIPKVGPNLLSLLRKSRPQGCIPAMS